MLGFALKKIANETGMTMDKEVNVSRVPVLAGHIFPTVDKFLVTPHEARHIFRNVISVFAWQDVLLIVLVGWFIIPTTQIVYDYALPTQTAFVTTYLSIFFSIISETAKIALVVYIIDLIDIALATLEFDFVHRINLPQTFAKIIYALYFARKVSMLKKYLLLKYLGEKKQKVGIAHLIDHLMNGVIGMVCLFTIIDVLDLKGAGLTSAITFGSAGTLAFTLASQSVVSQVVNGFALSASNRFYVGEFVQFGDGTTGTVEKLGWTEIILRGSDDLVISVPNTQLAGQRVSNLSRNKMCQVKQKLRFHYQDIDKIPDLCEGIKRHIKESCPELISDGSRPFRVFWTDYQDNYLEVSVDCHFQLKPIGDPYWSNRQQVLVAINEAVKEKSISFAVFVVPRLEVPEMK